MRSMLGVNEVQDIQQRFRTCLIPDIGCFMYLLNMYIYMMGDMFHSENVMGVEQNTMSGSNPCIPRCRFSDFLSHI